MKLRLYSDIDLQDFHAGVERIIGYQPRTDYFQSVVEIPDHLYDRNREEFDRLIISTNADEV